MGRIRILSDNVANKIAAGEVVERPASVVKELLENALDAGANDVRVDTENAGRRLIRIQDNGCGMLRDDAMLAFERHATSKLSDVKDLLSIATLGFRGEALPSIASVSRLLLETRSADEQTGTAVELAGGKMLRCDEIARTPGTTITVRDLFFNVPARKKFLRADPTELGHIGTLFTHYSLGHIDKRFELFHEGRELLNVTPVETHRDRAFQVFGSDIVDGLIEFERSAEISLKGLISGPHVKATRSSLFLFVNGRLVKDKVLTHAITTAYNNLMPGGTFPFALLFVTCDAAEVDVNVHPAKTEVRFREGPAVHDFVRDAIRSVLIQSRPVSSMPLMPSSPPPPPPPPVVFALPEILVPSAPRPRPIQRPPVIPDTHGTIAVDWEQSDNLTALPDLRPMGQLHDSFIIAAGRDGLWLIDQHVAHERILFEQTLRARMTGQLEIQQLLMPLVLQLTPTQEFHYARIATELQAHGFETEHFGQRTIAVTAAPAAVGPADIERILLEILDVSDDDSRPGSLDELRRTVCATIACRAAIKINTPLDPKKMDFLLRALAACEYPMTCPHGRPIALRYGTKDILKSFHRI